MFDPSNNMTPPHPSSPTISSLSSSDLDTESTGSFFQDRSTTLGNLMGVTIQAITCRSSSSHRHTPENLVSAVKGGRRPNKTRAAAARERRCWWRLCRDEHGSGRASLGEYLEVERRFGDLHEMPRNGPRALFEDGRVLPPVEVVEGSSPAEGGGFCRCAVVERWCGSLVL